MNLPNLLDRKIEKKLEDSKDLEERMDLGVK
jgi:hypothetical protein